MDTAAGAGTVLHFQAIYQSMEEEETIAQQTHPFPSSKHHQIVRDAAVKSESCKKEKDATKGLSKQGQVMPPIMVRAVFGWGLQYHSASHSFQRRTLC